MIIWKLVHEGECDILANNKQYRHNNIMVSLKKKFAVINR